MATQTIESLTTEQQATFRSEIGAGTPATTESVLALLNTSAAIIVNATGTDTERGAALVAAYTSAKTLTPNGAALSATNRAVVIMPPGKYKITAALEIDADFVDFLAQSPQSGGSRQSGDTDDFIENGGTPLTYFRPPPTLIYRDDTAQQSTIIQKAEDVRLTGFGIAHLGNSAAWLISDALVCALQIGSVGLNVNNSASIYETMYFWSRGAFYEDFGGVRGYWSFRGTWRNCIASSCSFRVGYGDRTNFPASVVFECDMIDCQAGPYSFMGDAYPAQTYIAQNSRLERCRVIGVHYDINGPISITDGFAGFSGCTAIGVPIASSCELIECVSGANSFGVGTSSAGRFIRCRGGETSFGATSGSTPQLGTFTGYAEDCFAGGGSFGGRNSLSDANNAAAYCSGTLIRCTCEGSTRPINLDGATIRDSRFTVTTTGQDCFKLLDGNSVISNTDTIVLQGGTGVPINAGSALNVTAYALRMNNATNDADGLGSNVTNLVISAGNVVSNSIT